MQEAQPNRTTNWKDNIAKLWWYVKVGNEAEGLRQSNRRFNNVESLTRDTRKFLMGDAVSSGPKPGEDEVNVGDRYEYVTNNHQAPSLLSKAIGPLLMAAGLGTAGYFVAEAIENRPVPVIPKQEPVEHTDTDTDTTIEMSLPDPADF